MNDDKCPLEHWPLSGRGILGCIVATAIKKGMSEEDAVMFAHEFTHKFETFQKTGGDKDISQLSKMTNAEYCMKVAKAATMVIRLQNMMHDILRKVGSDV